MASTKNSARIFATGAALMILVAALLVLNADVADAGKKGDIVIFKDKLIMRGKKSKGDIIIIEKKEPEHKPILVHEPLHMGYGHWGGI